MKVVSKMVLNDKEKIPETFLFQLYNREYQREVNEINYQFFENDTYFNREEFLKKSIEVLEDKIFKMCLHYLSLTNSEINVIPSDLFEFIDVILEKIQKNPYKKSFLLALNLFYSEYFSLMLKGNPFTVTEVRVPEKIQYINPKISKHSWYTIPNQTKKGDILEVVTDSKNKIVSFEGKGLNPIDRCQIMNKMVRMEKNGEIGPLPKVRQKIRKDI